MINPTEELERFKQNRVANRPRGYAANVEILHKMREHIMAMNGGKLPPRILPEDIEHKIRMAKILNAKLPNSNE